MRPRCTGWILLALTASVNWAAVPPESPPKTVPDRELGLHRGSVFEVTPPPVFTENTSDPGAMAPPPRAHQEAPPVVPHGVADFLPIRRGDNLCVDCHWLEEKEEGGPTPIPDSHFIDLRKQPGARRDELAGARYLCVTCHVAQTDAEPLVDNELGLD